jgi:hypothetical protein
MYTGAAVTDPGARAVMDQILRHVVVVRGAEAMPLREPIPLRVPRETLEAAAAAEQQAGLDPMHRGPEITEVR